MLEAGVLLKSRQAKITIIVISVTIFIIVAAVIASFVITTVIGYKNAEPVQRYYEGSFRMSYAISNRDPNSAEFKALLVQIERLTKDTFEDSVLKGQFSMAKVISLGYSGPRIIFEVKSYMFLKITIDMRSTGNVQPRLVILFQVLPTEMEIFSSTPIQNIFREIASRSSFNIDKVSVQLTEISLAEAGNLLYGDNKNAEPVPHYYEGSFRMSYTISNRDPNSAEFKALSVQIERLTKDTFEGSVLKGLFSMAKVISLGSTGNVQPRLVILFQVLPTEMKNFSSIPIQNIFRELASRSSFNIDKDSVQLTEISLAEAGNLLYGDCGVGGPKTSRIMGGSPAHSGSWPWQASLRFNRIHKCGASLINNTWLISAAYCFKLSKDVNSWTVVLGTLLSSPGNGLKLRRIIVHESFSRLDIGNDIALLELSAPVILQQNIRTVCLPKASDNFPDSSSCYVTGWGALAYGGPVSPILRQVDVKIISSDMCASPQMYGSIIQPSMLCAGYEDGGKDACQRDDGGPLVSMQNTKWFLIGIVSTGDECGLPNKPGIYTRVTYLRNWITQQSGL